MKTFLTLLCTLTLLGGGIANAKEASSVLDDASSFVIARSVKLGDSGNNNRGSQSHGSKTQDFSACSTDSDCPTGSACQAGSCKPVCSDSTCSGSTPECSVTGAHDYVCKCTSASCPDGSQCGADGKCTDCKSGESCGCPGSKVSDGKGGCVCSGNTSCSNGQKYDEATCSCSACKPSDTTCNCPGNSVPDNYGGCQCPSGKQSCEAGSQWNSTLCQCEACKAGDNGACENPCPSGQLPDGKGNCSAFECADDTGCPAGKQCQNPATSDAKCIPCAANTACASCEEGQIADGNGNCVTPGCSSDSDCQAGNHCENAGKSDAACTPDKEGEQGTCPDGWLADGKGSCKEIECKTDSDCTAGKTCKNGGTLNASCEPCALNAQCSTCPSGQVGDGKGGCKDGCAFTTASACVNGTTGCTKCGTMLNKGDGCYTCTACESGYYYDGKGCTACKSFDANCTSCSAFGCTACKTGYKAVSGRCVSTTCSSCYTWNDSQNKCVEDSCPSGYSTSTTWCSDGYSLSTTGSCGCGKCERIPGYCSSDSDCGSSQECVGNKCVALSCGSCKTATDHQCVANTCPSGWSFESGKFLLNCAYGQTKETDSCGCVRCVGPICSMGYSPNTTSCPGTQKLVTDGDCGKCVDLTCGTCEKAENNQCVAVSGCCTSDSQCSGSEECKGNSCQTITCGTCYKPMNHACVREAGSDCCVSDSECGSSQKCTNNKCVSVSCATCQTASNHKCTAVSGCCTSDSQCGGAQKCTNNKCVNLSCTSCQTASNHQCVTNACPDGWNEPGTLALCLNGQTKKTDSCGCWKCDGEACPDGYTRGFLGCLTSQKIATTGTKVNGQYCKKCVDKDCSDYGYKSQTDSCPKGEKMMAVTIAEASYLSCGKCSEINTITPIPIGGNISPQCPSSDIYCAGKGCCPKHANGCSEYANDCKSVGNGLYTACRCILYDTTSKITN